MKEIQDGKKRLQTAKRLPPLMRFSEVVRRSVDAFVLIYDWWFENLHVGWLKN